MILTEQQELIRDSAARFAEQRLAPNSRAWEHQAVAFRLADMATQLHAASSMVETFC